MFISVPSMTALGYAGWRYVRHREELTCRACARPVHHHMRTVAVVEGKRGFYCCPACALSEHRQAGAATEITELTDFQAGSPITPSQAYLVRDSDSIPCNRHQATVSPDKQPLHSHFDRCAPSILAFRTAAAARAFATEHGGQVLPFSELAAQFSH